MNEVRVSILLVVTLFSLASFAGKEKCIKSYINSLNNDKSYLQHKIKSDFKKSTDIVGKDLLVISLTKITA